MKLFLCLFVCFESHEQFFSYLATVTITGDGAANLDLCLALTVFSSEGSFTCLIYCDTRPPFLRSYPKDPWFYLLNAVLLAKEQSLPILNVLGLTRPAQAGLELTTYRLLSENTTTRLRQPVRWNWKYIIIGYRLCMGKYDDRVSWRVEGTGLRGPSATKNEVIIFSHTVYKLFIIYFQFHLETYNYSNFYSFLLILSNKGIKTQRI
jgi:hypothetical protein